MEVLMSEEKKVSRAGKYLTFNLGAEEYGFEILRVVEIIGLMKITSVPRTPNYVRGIINLRGTIHPVIDLRTKFGMDTIDDTQETCIIVLEIEKNGISEQIGVVVDNVKEVQDITDAEIEDTPSLGHDVDTKFITGMANIKDKVVILLNVERIFSEKELEEVASIN
jgi:purine-binding chemotaxis protein CheW